MLVVGYRELTWSEMATMVKAIRKEAKRRNPIGINLYVGYLDLAADAVQEIADAEKCNFTSEHGPQE